MMSGNRRIMFIPLLAHVVKIITLIRELSSSPVLSLSYHKAFICIAWILCIELGAVHKIRYKSRPDKQLNLANRIELDNMRYVSAEEYTYRISCFHGFWTDPYSTTFSREKAGTHPRYRHGPCISLGRL